MWFADFFVSLQRYNNKNIMVQPSPNSLTLAAIKEIGTDSIIVGDFNAYLKFMDELLIDEDETLMRYACRAKRKLRRL